MSLTTFKAAIAALIPSGKLGGLLAADHRAANEAMINKMYMPEGTGFPFFGDNAPDGFHLFDGGELSRTGCPLLFALWGTKYGAGDGSTTFNCPVMEQGGSPVQCGSKIAVGAKGGSMEHTNTLEELFPHKHPILGITGGDNNDNSNTVRFAGGDKNQGETDFYFENSEACKTIGGGKTYSIMNPYIGVNWIFRLE